MDATEVIIGTRVVPVGSKNLSRLSHTRGGSRTESLTSLCPLFPYLHVLRFFCFSVFSFCIRLFSPVRRLRRARVLYRAQLLTRKQIPPPGERALCPERNTSVVAQYPVIAPFSSTNIFTCFVVFCFSAFFILHKALLSCAPPSPGPGALRGATARPETDSSTGRARPLSSQSCLL